MGLSKRCCECGEVKPSEEFHSSKSHGGVAPRCKPCALAVAKTWYQQNKDRKRAYDASRRKQQPGRYRAASKRHREKHPDKKNAGTSARRRRVREQMPPWVRPSAMKVFYEAAIRVTKCLGIDHHVDHVVPLRAKCVSGLHVPWNLQVIPAVLNVRKHNRFMNSEAA